MKIWMERGHAPLRVLCHNRRVQHCKYLTLEHSLRWCCHDYTSLFQALHNQLLSYKSLARWNSVPKLSMHSSLQDTSCRLWCWWVAGNNWSHESYSCSCTLTMNLPKLSQDTSVEDLPPPQWNLIHLWKQDSELIRVFTLKFTLYMQVSGMDHHPVH